MNWQKYGWAIGFAVLFLFAGVGYWIVTMGGERAAPEGEIRLPPVPSPEEQIRREFNTAIAGHDGEPLTLERTAEGWVIAVERKAEDALDVKELLEGAAELFHQLTRVGEPIARAAILYRTDVLRDVYGNQLKDVAIARVEMAKENLARIDWRGFKPAHFPEVAEDFWLHEELQKDWEEYRRTLDEGGAGSEQGQNSGNDGQGASGGNTPSQNG